MANERREFQTAGVGGHQCAVRLETQTADLRRGQPGEPGLHGTPSVALPDYLSCAEAWRRAPYRHASSTVSPFRRGLASRSCNGSAARPTRSLPATPPSAAPLLNRDATAR